VEAEEKPETPERERSNGLVAMMLTRAETPGRRSGRPNGLQERDGEAPMRQVGNVDPAMVVSRETAVAGERKAAVRSRSQAGLASRRGRGASIPLL
jgi:hypothetical protein